jgi:hypothetical protein
MRKLSIQVAGGGGGGGGGGGAGGVGGRARGLQYPVGRVPSRGAVANLC